MITTCVHVEVKPEFVDEFIIACEKNHYESVKENGNLRFDVIQEHENPCKFLLYEAYFNDETAAAHKTTNHYQEWRNAVEKMMAKPRKGVKHKILFPKQF
jgi:(4S)-4-hydroxy-5-phosphonooxypentane-2,3-dione isomerase